MSPADIISGRHSIHEWIERDSTGKPYKYSTIKLPYGSPAGTVDIISVRCSFADGDSFYFAMISWGDMLMQNRSLFMIFQFNSLKPLVFISKLIQKEESMMHRGAPPNKTEILLSTKQMPEKLEEEDAGKLFAQPLDLDEAYYGFPEKAMDFGTMRSKLGEGLYKDLKEFKDDVFLITNNVMELYPACTINFRQAHAIYVLAKSLFKTLEAKLSNAELKVSMMEHGKKTQHESEGLHVNQLRRRSIVADSGPSGGIHTESSSKSTSHGMLHGKQSKGVSKDPCVKAGQQLKRNNLSCNVLRDEAATGANKRRNVKSHKTDRRPSYNQTSTVSTVNDFPKQHLPVNENTRYEDSLMRVMEGLEPTAWEVARKELSSFDQASNHPYVPSSGMLISSSDTQLLPNCVGSTSLGFWAPGTQASNNPSVPGSSMLISSSDTQLLPNYVGGSSSLGFWAPDNQASNNPYVPSSSMLISSSDTQLLPNCVGGSTSSGFWAPGNQASNNPCVPGSNMLISSSDTQLLPNCVGGSTSLGFGAPGNAGRIPGEEDSTFDFMALLNSNASEWSSDVLPDLYKYN